MEKTVIVFVVALVVSILAWIANHKEIAEKSAATAHAVTQLFEQDGCRIYRFSDNGSPHYFTTCQGKVSE